MFSAKQISISIIIAIFIAVLMTILSAVPPFSIFYQWLIRNELNEVWYGLIAGTIGFCLVLYHRKNK